MSSPLPLMIHGSRIYGLEKKTETRMIELTTGKERAGSYLDPSRNTRGDMRGRPFDLSAVTLTRRQSAAEVRDYTIASAVSAQQAVGLGYTIRVYRASLICKRGVQGFTPVSSSISSSINDVDGLTAKAVNFFVESDAGRSARRCGVWTEHSYCLSSQLLPAPSSSCYGVSPISLFPVVSARKFAVGLMTGSSSILTM